MNTFKELKLCEPCFEAIQVLGFTQPTPIQQQAIPKGMNKHDILAAAQTGTGKTLAYLIPIFDQMVRFYGSKRPKGNKGPYALVLSPTRELAQQIAQCAETIASVTNFRVQTVIGGKKYSAQINRIKQGCDILIATPGRLLDLLKQDFINLRNIHYLVLDEVDRMLDMGFWPDVYTLIKAIPAKRQTFFFSATLTPVVLEKAAILLHEPVRIEIALKGETAENVQEFVLPVVAMQKQDLLVALLKQHPASRAIVFTATKQEADSCARKLQNASFKVDSIHSDKTQGKRDKALHNFKKGTIDVLVATDVLARGIDVSEVDIVVNLSVPEAPEDYIHRIGRTGRAGESGCAYTFMSPDQFLALRNIEYFTKQVIQTLDIEGFDYHEGRLVPDPKRSAKRSSKMGSRRRPSLRRR